MAGTRPLKNPDARRNNHPPQLGEWVDLPPLEEPVLPAYPIDWYRRDQRANVIPKHIWDLWRIDAATGQWSPGDLALAFELGQTWQTLKPEHRLRATSILGLNAKGRRDLRWREPAEAKAVERTEQSEVRRLRIVAETEPEAS